jgi:hypothetical protein
MGRTRRLDSKAAAMVAGELLLIQRYPFNLSAELSCAYGKAVLTARLAGRASLPSRYRPKRVRCSRSGHARVMQGGDCWRNSGKQENELRAPTIGATSDARISAPNF